MSPTNNLNNNNSNNNIHHAASDVPTSATTGTCKMNNNFATTSNGNASSMMLKKNQLSTGDLTNTYELSFREGHVNGGGNGGKGNIPRSTSWYDGVFGCLKPVWNLMGKGKPSNLQHSNEGKKYIYTFCMHMYTYIHTDVYISLVRTSIFPLSCFSI